MAETIKVSTFVNVPKESVWEYFTLPEHITGWYFATPEWRCPRAENDLRKDGKFTYRMEAKDGSVGFDFAGTYDEVVLGKELRYTLDDGRKVTVTFDENSDGTLITETFHADAKIPLEMQQQGWQNILNNFKQYAESQ